MNQYKSGTDEEEPQTLVIEPHSELAISHSGPEILKKSSPKKTREIKFFLTKFHFLQFQKWPKINFRTGKKFKLPKM